MLNIIVQLNNINAPYAYVTVLVVITAKWVFEFSYFYWLALFEIG